MKATLYSGKPFMAFRGRWDCLDEISIPTPEYINNAYYEHRSYNRPDSVLSLDTQVKGLQPVIYKNVITELKPDKVLYFDKSSKYPRFKIKDSGYKRCIKPDKADYIVIGDECRCEYCSEILLLEDENFFYVFSARMTGYYMQRNSEIRDAYNKDAYAFLKKHPNMFPNKKVPKAVFQGDLYVTNFATTAVKIINGEYKLPIITDKALDTIISGTMPQITEDEFESVRSLIESPDKESKGLGLRLLAGYDLSEVMSSIKFLFIRNQYELTYTSEWNTTAVKLLRKQLGYIPNYNMYSIRDYMQIEPKSDLDKTLLRKMIIDSIKIKVGRDLQWLQECIKESNPYDIKIDIKIE